MFDTRLGPRVLRGMEFHLFGQLAVLAVNLLATPIIVHGLNTDGYALYTFMWTLCGYLILLNLGTSTTIQRYTAVLLGRDDSPSLSFLLRRLLLLHAVMGALGGVSLAAAGPWIIRLLLHTHGAVLDAAYPVLLWVALASPFYFVLQFALNLLYGEQRFGVYNAFLALQTVIIAAGAAGLVMLRHGLPEIAAFFAAANAALALAALWTARAPLLLPERPISAADRREIASFSLKNLANLVLWTFIFQGDRVFVGSMLPLSQLGYYVVPAALMQKLNMLSGAVVATTFPMIAELHGRSEEERLRRLYLKSAELSLFLLLPLSIITFVLAPQFLTVWLGGPFSQWATWPMRLMLIANLIYFSVLLPSNIATSKGYPEAWIYLQSGKTVLLLCAWPLLIPRFGIVGAAGGSLAAEILCAPLFIHEVHRRFLDLGWTTFLKESCVRPAIAGACLLALGLSVHTRADTWPKLILSGAAGSTLYLAVGYRLLDADARGLLWDWIRRKI